MSLIPAGDVRLEVSDGPYTDMTYRGGVDGGYIVWDEQRRQLRDWYDPTPDAVGLRGVQYIDGVGLILNWQCIPTGIDESQWTLSTDGQFAVVRPPGEPSVTRWHQYDSTPDLAWWACRRGWDAGRPFSVSIYREATPRREGVVRTDSLPYLYTGVQFGGRYELRLPKWRPVELWKLVGGEWRLVLTTQWRHAELYNDSHSQQELWVTVMPVDGRLLLCQSNYTDQPVAYVEERPIALPEAPIVVRGNGGAAYFGLHDIEFAQGEQTLYSRTGVGTRQVWSMPTSMVLGSKAAATTAAVDIIDESGAVIDQARYEQLWASTTHNGKLDVPVALTYRQRLRLRTWDPHQTPVVQYAGTELQPNPRVVEQAWDDISDRVISVTGGWQVDLSRRMGWQEYSVELDNSDGYFRAWDRTRLCRLSLGYAGTALGMRAQSYIYIDGDAAQNIASATVTARTLDRLQSLDEIECGYRAPQDGLYVWEAVLHVLRWAGFRVHPYRFLTPPLPGDDDIGYLHMSGRRLPTSRYEAARRLGVYGVEVQGAGADEQRAVAQPEPDMSCGEYLRYIMQYDRDTFLWIGTDGLVYYRPLASVTTTHHMFEADALDAVDAIRGSFEHQARLRARKTSVRITGRDRVTRAPLTAYQRDAAAIATGSTGGHVGYDRPHRVSDDKCNSWAMVVKRAAWEYATQRALQSAVSFECLGQPERHCLEGLIPHETRTRGGGRLYIITGVRDELTADRRYTGQIDAIDADDFVMQVGP